jgi:chromate transporter
MSKPPSPDTPPLVPQPPSLTELFTAFLTCALHGFGGVLPWARRMMVEHRRWMTAEEFNDAYALCNFLPGPNIVNFVVVYGRKVRGMAGAVAAFVGLVAPPVAVVIVFGMLYARYGEIETLRRVLAGFAAAAAGLMIATGIKMAQPLFNKGFGLAPVIAVATFIAVGPLRLSLPLVLLVMAPTSVALAWWLRR